MNEEDQLSAYRRCMKEAEDATPTWELWIASLKPGSKKAVQAENEYKEWKSMTPQQRSNKLYWDDMLYNPIYMVLMVPIHFIDNVIGAITMAIVATIVIVITPFALTYSTIKKIFK